MPLPPSPIVQSLLTHTQQHRLLSYNTTYGTRWLGDAALSKEVYWWGVGE
jgi:hypothetical protein